MPNSQSRRLVALRLFVLGCLLALGSACDGKDDEASNGDGGATDVDSGAAAHGGSGAGSGTAGSGAAGDGAADGGTPDGGSITPGPGVRDADGEAFCLIDQADTTAAYYFGIKKQCQIYDKVDGTFTDAEKQNYDAQCTTISKGTVVAACPAAGRVAYCAADTLTAGGTLHQQKVIYESTINPDGDAVARNSLQVCGALPGFDLDDKPLETKCKGTLEAKVDGKLIDFSGAFICTYKTDGTRHSYLVRGTDKVNAADSKELTLYIAKNGATVELAGEIGQQPYGYLEGATASGAFAFPVTGETTTYTSTTYSEDGEGLSGSFELGKITTSASGSGGTVREITAGKLNLTFDVL